MDERNILIALGSPSDRELLRQVTLPTSPSDKVHYFLSIASAHRTPEAVERHAKAEAWDAIIACAGLTNALLSEYLKSARPQTLVIGVPVDDRATDGLSSLLSSTELPPGYAAAAVGVGQLEKAARLARELVTTLYDKVVICEFNERPGGEKKWAEKVGKQLYNLNVPCRIHDEGAVETQKNELALVIDGLESGQSAAERYLTRCGVAVVTKRHVMSYGHYKGQAGIAENALYVGLASVHNLAYFGAKVISRQRLEVGERIIIEQSRGRDRYEPYAKVIPLTPGTLTQVLAAK